MHFDRIYSHKKCIICGHTNWVLSLSSYHIFNKDVSLDSRIEKEFLAFNEELIKYMQELSLCKF